MISFAYSAAVNGIDACIIEVETYISSGMPVFSIVGLLDAAVKESKDRVFAALKNSGFDFPAKKITVDRKSTRLNSSHVLISYAVFCLKKKRKK